MAGILNAQRLTALGTRCPNLALRRRNKSRGRSTWAGPGTQAVGRWTPVRFCGPSKAAGATGRGWTEIRGRLGAGPSWGAGAQSARPGISPGLVHCGPRSPLSEK